jgi:ABC-type sugar transport system permease subunit
MKALVTPSAASRGRARLEGRPSFLRREPVRRSVMIWCLLAPSLAIFAAYRILPLGWNLLLSFEAWSPYRPARWAGLDNYQDLLTDDVFWEAFWNTLIFMASAPIGIALALAVAVLVDMPIRGREVYRTVVFLSYPLMTVAVGIIWRWMYDERVGLINFVLRGAGLIHEPIAFLQSFSWSLPAVIVAGIWQILGFYMIVLLTGLQSIPGELYEAAEIDGAGAAQRFLKISLPLLRPSIFLCFIIGMLNSFTSFDLVYVMTNGGPGHATELLVTYIYKLGFGETRFDYAAAVTVVLFLLLILIAWAGNRLSGGDAGAVEKAEAA